MAGVSIFRIKAHAKILRDALDRIQTCAEEKAEAGRYPEAYGTASVGLERAEYEIARILELCEEEPTDG